MKYLRLLSITCLALLTGCTTRLTDFTIISTKNVEFSALSRAKKGGSRVRGEDLVHLIILIPTGVPNMKTAIDKAIESVPGAVALTDGVLYAYSWYIPYVYGQSAYVVEGTPLIIPSSAAKAPAQNRMIVRYDAHQQRYVSEAVSAEHYDAVKRKLAVAASPLRAIR